MFKSLSFLLIFFALSSTSLINLHSSPEIDLLYSFPAADTIEFTLQFFTQGYIAIGFGTRMVNSQIYLCYKPENSAKFTVVSAHAAGHTVPTPDSQQNLEFVSGDRDSQKTVVVFRRKLVTGNANDVEILKGKPMDLVWAYGKDDNLVHHVEHGYQSVTFQEGDRESFLGN